MTGRLAIVPGLVLAGAGTLVAWAVHAAVPAIPLLTAAVALGMIVAQFPRGWTRADTLFAPGLRTSSRRLLRIGIVLLGLKLSLVDIAELGWATILAIVVIVAVVFGVTWLLGLLLRLPGAQPLLVAAGFSICGVSAIGAMSAVTRSKDEDTAAPVALVTLCGTLAIFVLPLLRFPLGLGAEQFGMWVGLSVHDVGQVVATAQIAGPAALSVAVVVKLTRVLTLAPMVAIVGGIERVRARRHEAGSVAEPAVAAGAPGDASGRVKLPPIIPLFIAGFLAAVLIRTFVPLPAAALDVADLAQTILLAMALFALGTSIRFATLFRTGWRALVVGLISWALIAGLSLGAVWVLT